MNDINCITPRMRSAFERLLYPFDGLTSAHLHACSEVRSSSWAIERGGHPILLLSSKKLEKYYLFNISRLEGPASVWESSLLLTHRGKNESDAQKLYESRVDLTPFLFSLDSIRHYLSLLIKFDEPEGCET